MPRNDSGFLKYIAVAVPVLGVSVAIGYMLSNNKPATNTSTVVTDRQPASASVDADKTTGSSSGLVASNNQNADYQAPGAPKVDIREEKNPVLVDKSQSSKIIQAPGTSKDYEANQEGAPSAVPASPNPDGLTTPNNAVAAPSPAVDGSGTDTTSSNNSSGAIIRAPKSTSNVDGEAGQDQPSDTSSESSSAQYRVQAGAFGENKNARILADTLKSKGYSTMLRQEHDGDRTIYRVQVGTYRSKSAASRAANSLQKDGYPASVSPISQ